MIVLDASAVLEWLLQTPSGARVEARAFSPAAGRWHAPHLLDVEIAQALRRYVRMDAITAQRGREALVDLMDLPITRYPHDPFLARIWALRDHLTAYDAAYIALAEALDASLLTCDDKLKTAIGHSARVEVL